METGLALVPRIDQNLFEFYEYAAFTAGKPRVRDEGYSYIALNPSPWANTVYNLDLNDDTALARLALGIRSGGIPNKVVTGPTVKPRDAERLILEAGFERRVEARGMTLELSRRARVDAPFGFILALLTTATQFEAFARIVVANLFNKEAELSPAYANLLMAMVSERAFGFLGYFDGQPVSAAFAFIDGEGEGGLYFVATVAQARGRGFGAATVSAVLDELEFRGASSCILQASALGKPVYDRLGFEDACALGRYALPEALIGKMIKGER
jgi:GNAT superfamily N-acetyltransferase